MKTKMLDRLKALVEGAEEVDIEDMKLQEVKLLKTTFNDPHIKKIMQHITGGDPVKLDALKDEVEKRLKQFECVARVSPILYEAGLDNIIESVLFGKFWVKADESKPGKKPDPLGELAKIMSQHPGYVKEAPKATTAPQFDTVTFMSLISKIKAESKSFFPLRNMVDYHVIKNPRICFSGAGDEKLEKHLESMDTAAATADGTFVFNKPFCQSLLDFAHLKGLKAANTRYGKKYKSNGGDIPDEWEYIEFLIRHEFMHYTYSDFHYQKVIPDASAKLINWVGDFRSNHRLVEQGFNQLPMGLFSSYVNFHKQSSYSEMYNLVRSEFAKLPKQCQTEISNEFDKLGDDHSQQGNKTNGEAKPVDPIDADAVDKWNKKVNDKTKADDKRVDTAPPDYENKPPEKRDSGTQRGGKHEIDYTKISPKYKWDDLLRKMISETSFIIEPSYQRISRRAIGTMQQVITRGRGAVKPGDMKIPSKKKIKLAVIIDSSGSMSYVIHTVMANVANLLLKRQATMGVNEEFYLFTFSGDYEIYLCDASNKSGIAQHITDVDKKVPGEIGRTTIKNVLNNHKSGGTVFSSELAGQINKLAAKGYNCLIVSDGDLTEGDNFTNFKELYMKHRRNVWLLLDSKSTFTTFIQKMKELTNNASHL